MNRRDFIKNIGIAAAGTMFLPQFLQAKVNNTKHKKLVVVQLSGGNDGLNTIVPFRNDIYYKLRPQIGLKEEKLISLNDELAFNKALKGIAHLYDQGYLSIVNAVGYPNPNRSHFRSMEIWHTATDSNKYATSGWLGRYLDSQCIHSRSAIELDKTMSLALKGEHKNGMSFENLPAVYKTTNAPFLKELADNGKNQAPSGNPQLDYLYKNIVETHQNVSYLHQKNKTINNTTTYPNTPLGKHLKSIATLIKSGVDTSVFYTSHNGFDTHANQANQHFRLLETYSEAMEAFVKDLKKSDDFKDTLILTFSEFGRRVQQNGSRGTDHGKGNNLFLIGENLKKKGLYNTFPSLTDLDKGDVKYQVDFRDVYADIITHWLGGNAEEIIGRKANPLGII